MKCVCIVGTKLSFFTGAIANTTAATAIYVTNYVSHPNRLVFSALNRQTTAITNSIATLAQSSDNNSEYSTIYFQTCKLGNSK